MDFINMFKNILFHKNVNIISTSCFSFLDDLKKNTSKESKSVTQKNVLSNE